MSDLRSHLFANVVTVLGAGCWPLAAGVLSHRRGFPLGDRVLLGLSVFLAVCIAEVLALGLFRPLSRWAFAACRRVSFPLWLPGVLVFLVAALTSVVGAQLGLAGLMWMRWNWVLVLSTVFVLGAASGFLFSVYWLVFAVSEHNRACHDV